MAQKRYIDSIHMSERRGEPDNTWEFFGNSLSRVFGDIIADEDLLRECYCPVRSRKFDEQFITSINTGIPGAIFCSPKVHENPAKFIEDWITDNDIKISPNPYIIIGDVGTGKSTFIHYQFKIFLKENNLLDRLRGVIIDLGYYDKDINRIKENIHAEIESALISQFPEIAGYGIKKWKEIYKQQLVFDLKIYDELMKIDETSAKMELGKKILNLHNNKRIRIASLLDYFRRNRPEVTIIIVLDNVDHHPKDIQEEIFFFSRSLLHDYKCSIIMTARKYTVPKIYRHVGLSAFQPRFLALSLPVIDEVIRKRKNYILSKPRELEKLFLITEKNEIEIITHGKRWSLKLPELRDRMEMILNCFLTKEITYVLNHLFDFDFRTIMKAIKVSLSSGFLYEEKSRKDYVTVSDFLRSIMLGNNPFYDPDDSLIVNIFCNGNKNVKGNNLIRFRLLQAMRYFGRHVAVKELFSFLQSIGYREQDIRILVDYYLKIGLIESPLDEGFSIDDDISLLSLTYSGKYYLDHLVANPRYLQHLVNSSYIDNEHYEFIQELLNEKGNTAKDRIIAIYNATDSFIEYLYEKEKEELNAVNYIGKARGKEYLRQLADIKKTMENYFEDREKILDSI